MNSTMMKFAFAAAVVTAAGGVLAQEMGAATMGESRPAESNAEKLAADQGVVMAVESQEAAPAKSASKDELKSEGCADATELLRKELGPRYAEGYHPDREAFIQFGAATRRCDSLDDLEDFMAIRDMMAAEAVLQAKARIVMSIRANYRAKQGLKAQKRPDFKKRFKREIAAKDKLKQELNQALVKFAPADVKLGEIEDEVAWQAWIGDVLVAEQGRIAQKGAVPGDDFIKIQESFAEVKRQIAHLNSEALALSQTPLNEYGSEIEAIIKEPSPILGCTVLKQAESFVDGQYQIAVAVVWSDKLSQRAEQTLAGKAPAGNKHGDCSLDQWLEKNKENLVAAVGSRQFTDDKGRQYFLGISANEYDPKSETLQQDMDETVLFAKQAALFALYSEVVGGEGAKRSLASFRGKKHEAMATYATEFKAEFPSKNVSGLTKKFDVKTVHRLTGKKVYVAVAVVDGAVAAKSSEWLKKLYAAKAEVAIHSDYLGRAHIPNPPNVQSPSLGQPQPPVQSIVKPPVRPKPPLFDQDNLKPNDDF